MFHWGVTIPSTEGPVDILVDRITPLKTYSQESPTDKNNYSVTKTLLLGWVALLSDSPLGPMDPRTLKLFAHSIAKDPFGLIKTYAGLATLLMKSERCTDGVLTREYIKGFEETPFFRVYLEYYRTGDPALLSWLLSVTSFGKKAPYDRPDLELEAYAKWRECEKRLEDVKVDAPVVRNVARIIHWLLDGFSFDIGALTPHHGPGNVADPGVGRSIEEKCRSLVIPPSLVDVYGFFMPQTYESAFGGVFWTRTVNGSAPTCIHSFFPDFQGYYDISYADSLLTFVPKDYKSLRTICMQPSGIMYIEQGLRDQLYKFFEESKMLEFCDLSDQTVNRRAALIGSALRLIDTIDMSSASDLVLWALILACFPERISGILESVRVPTVVYGTGKEKVTMRVLKYAPMGSALCFPIMCIVFTAIVIADGIAKNFGQDVCVDDLPDLDVDQMFHLSYTSSKDPRRNRYTTPKIYGDDVCLDGRQTPSTMNALEALGFIVNRDKSFTGDETFRESCGGFYSRGVTLDVLKHDGVLHEDDSMDLRNLAGFIDRANRAYDAGFLNLYNFYKRLALFSKVQGVAQDRKGRNPILFSNNTDEVLAIRYLDFGHNPNAHLYTTSKPIDVGGRRPRHVVGDKIVKDKQWDHPGCAVYHESYTRSLGLGRIGRSPHSGEFDNYYYLQWQRSQWYGHNDPPPWKGTIRAEYRDVVPRMRWTRTRDVLGN